MRAFRSLRRGIEQVEVGVNAGDGTTDGRIAVGHEQVVTKNRGIEHVREPETAAAVDGPRGTVPKPTADQYPAHGAQEGITIGATLLKAKDVRQAFST